MTLVTWTRKDVLQNRLYRHRACGDNAEFPSIVQ